MELDSYCQNVGAELTGWKSRISQVVNKLDRLPTRDKSKVVAQINELHMIVEELHDRIHRLEGQCSTQWEPDKFELEGNFKAFYPRWEDVWPNVSPGDVGG